MGHSRFYAVDPGPKDLFSQLIAEFRADTSPKKVSLNSGMYWDEEGKLPVFPVVKKATSLLLSPHKHHSYLPVHGNEEFIPHAQRLVFGETLTENLLSGSTSRLASIHTVSGTAANHLGANFLAQNIHPQRVWIPELTWNHHSPIWQIAGESMRSGTNPPEIRFYPYYDRENHALDFQGMMDILEREAGPDDVLVLHACAHNPTGVDPSEEQWRTIADFCSLRKVFPFFDLAYQGFVTGSLDQDAWAIRHFVRRDLELCVAQTFSKTMGLYGERVGALHLVTSSGDAAARCFGRMSYLQKGEVYCPPAFGANIATIIMSNPELESEWRQHIFGIHERLKTMRTAFVKELQALGTPGGWERLENQAGMFACVDLTPAQIDVLKTQYHIYITNAGRLSISGLNRANVAYVAKALDTVIREELGNKCKETSCQA